MNFKANSFKELNFTNNNNRTISAAQLAKQKEFKTLTPIRREHYQMFSSSQVESYHNNCFHFNQTHSLLSDHVFNTKKGLHVQQKCEKSFANMKENIETNVTKSPLKKIEKKGHPATNLKGPLTPNSRMHTQLNISEWKLTKKHRKKFSSELQDLSEVENLSSIKQQMENRCKTSTNQLTKHNQVHFQTESLRVGNRQRSFGKGIIQNLFISQAKLDQNLNEKTLIKFKCCNKDGKIAKYKVVSQQFLKDDLFYCTRCTISLVQKGFILEEIDVKQSKVQPKLQPDKWCLQLQKKRRKSLHLMDLLKKQHAADLKTIEHYYHQLNKCITEYQKEDLSVVEHYYTNKQIEIQKKIEQIDQRLITLQTRNQTEIPVFEKQDITQLLQKSEDKLPQKLIINEEMTDIFSSIFDQQFRPNLEIFNCFNKEDTFKKIEHQSTSTNLLESINGNNALRFSFEKVLNDNGKKKKIQSVANLQNYKMQVNLCESPAFRHLFPEQESIVQISTDVSSPTFKNI